MSTKLSETSDELERAQIMLQEELTADSSKLKEQLAEKEGELLLLTEKDSQSQLQIKELGETVATLQRELESVRSRIIDLERDSEAEKLVAAITKEELEREKQEKSKLSNQITSVEKALVEKEAAYNWLKVENIQIYELEDQVESLKQRVSDLSVSLKDAEEENKAISSKNLETTDELEQTQNTIQDLRVELGELKDRHKKKESELSSLAEAHEKFKRDSQVEKLAAAITKEELEDDLGKLKDQHKKKESELSSLVEVHEAHKRDSSSQVKGLEARLASAEKQVIELNKKKSEEISEYLSQIINLKEEIINKGKDHESILEERNGLSEKIKGVELELETLQKQKSEFDGELRTMTEENVQMQDKINEASSETMALKEQINNLKHELDSLQVQKSETKAELEREKQEKSELSNQITSVEKALVEKEAAYNWLKVENMQIYELEDQVESLKQRVSDLSVSLKDAEEENKAISSKNLETTDKLEPTQNTIQDLRDELRELKDRHKEKESELSSLAEAHEKFKRHSEVEKVAEAITKEELEGELGKLKDQHKKKENELSSLVEVHEAHKRDSTRRVEELVALVTQGLRDDMEELNERHKENERQSSSQVKGLETRLRSAQRQVIELNQSMNSAEEVKKLLLTQIEEEQQNIQELLHKFEQLKKSHAEREKELEAELGKLQEQCADLTDNKEDGYMIGQRQGKGINLANVHLSNPDIYPAMEVNLEEAVTEMEGYKVFQGTRDKRKVFVKQIPLSTTAVNIAVNERMIHYASEDNSKFILRHHGLEVSGDFIYVCLQPWDCTLSELISFYSGNQRSLYPNQRDYLNEFRANNNLWDVGGGLSSLLISLIREVVNGVSDLHSEGIVHRNISPESFYIISKGKGKGVIVKIGGLRMGKLGNNSAIFEKQIRFAPEQIQRKKKVEGSINDVFFLGCTVGFMISGQDVFINNFDGSPLATLTLRREAMDMIEQSPEGHSLFNNLTRRPSEDRVTAEASLAEPLFWSSEKRLQFCVLASHNFIDFFEPRFYQSILTSSPIVFEGENRWDTNLESPFRIEASRLNHNNNPVYNTTQLLDLIRFIRNAICHARENSADIEAMVGQSQITIYEYFEKKFPQLLVQIYWIASKYFKRQKDFQCYFTN